MNSELVLHVRLDRRRLDDVRGSEAERRVIGARGAVWQLRGVRLWNGHASIEATHDLAGNELFEEVLTVNTQVGSSDRVGGKSDEGRHAVRKPIPLGRQ